MKTYHVGIYARLSRDDERQGESVSIENQKLMLSRYCAQQGWEVAEIYVDDGWSGTNFDRPGFGALMEAVREKRIDLVLVKDLSRLGRDYIEVGKYTDCVFPYYGCRFIALNDGVDTLRQNDDVTMIFKNVINDIYARDTSKKIRAVRRANAESGKFMGYKAPYGYLRSPEDKHRLVIDPEAAEVVRRIFSLRKEGMGFQAIADHLNGGHLPSPRDYAAGTTGHTWSRETVRAILGNEAYIGNLVQLKQGSISYKDHRQRQKPPEAWARVPGTHAPIVDKDTWRAVRALEQSGHKPRRGRREDPLVGLLYCSACGKAMKRVTNYKDRGAYTYYICRGHVCIGEAVLREILSQELQLWGIEEEVQETLKRQKKEELQGNRKRTEKRLLELEALMARLYEDRTNGKVSSETYACLMARYEAERSERQRERDDAGDLQEWAGEPEKMWRALISRIEVSPKERKEKRQELCIQYRFGEDILL